MKKIAKKLSAMALAVVMLAALCIPALATSTPTTGSEQKLVTPSSTATVVVGVADPSNENWTSANGFDHLLAYQVVSITYDETLNTLKYEFTPLFQGFLTVSDDETWKGLTPEGYGELTEDALKPLLGAFTAYIKGQDPKPTTQYEEDTVESGLATFEEMPMGQYIIVGDGSSTGAKIYQTVTAEVKPEVVTDTDGNDFYMLYNSYDVSMKTSTPTIGKGITAGTVQDDKITTGKQEGDKHTTHQETSEIGKVVTYTLTIKVPTYPENAVNQTFYVGDVLSKGLTLDPDSIVVKGDGNELNANANPLIYKASNTVYSETDGTTLYVDFDFDAIDKYDTITVTYSATVNENAELGIGVGNRNNAELIYSNSPFDGSSFKPGDDEKDRPIDEGGYGKDEDMEIVYTYALVIDKFEEKQEGEKLAGAVFELYREYNGETKAYSDPVLTKDEDGNDGPVVTLTTDANGAAKYEGLEVGDYYLKEVKAPTGYNLLEVPVVIKIDASNIPFMTETGKSVIHYTYTAVSSEALPDHTGQAEINGVSVWMNTTTGEVRTAEEQPEGFVAAYVNEAKPEVKNVIEIAKGEPGAGYYKAGVSNASGAQLPSTGGVGTTIFYIVGGCLVLGAVILLITKRRMGGTED